MILTDNNNQTVQLGSRIASGGEGAIFAVLGEPHFVAKIYHKQTPEQGQKLAEMLRNPPATSAPQQHVSICWPQRILFSSRSCVGFLMPRIDTAKFLPLLKLYSHQDRVNVLPGFTWRHLLRAASHIAKVVENVHARGYVIGDVNESNFLVSTRALVTLVDCDSMQVPAPGGQYFRCTVGKPEFMAPELQSLTGFGQINRAPAHDRFALAVLLFQTLMEGVHPYAGVWRGAGEDPPLHKRIQNGDCPYTGSSNILPMPFAPPLWILPQQLQQLFIRCFNAGGRAPGQRPTAQEWSGALTAAESSLVVCTRNTQHVYANHTGDCPWCKRTEMLGGNDPFPHPAAPKPAPAAPRPPPARPAQPTPTPQPSAPAAATTQTSTGIEDAIGRCCGCVVQLAIGIFLIWLIKQCSGG